MNRTISGIPFRGLSVTNLPDRLRDLVRKGNVLPAVKPCVLFNLALQILDSEERPDLKEPMLAAFRKWAVKRAYSSPTLGDS